MFTNKTSTPDEISRYRFILIFIIVIIIVAIINRDFRINYQQIKWKSLMVYTAIIVGLFILLMKWHAGAIANIEAQEDLTEEEKQVQIRKLDNVWSLSHFTFYVGLGILMPNNWTLILTLQICWELFEDFLGYRLGKKQYIETDGKKMFDIVCNSSGYLIGNIVSNRLNVKRKRS